MTDAFLSTAAPGALAPWLKALAALAGYCLLAAFGLWYGRGWPAPPHGSPGVVGLRAAAFAGATAVASSALLSAREGVPAGLPLAQSALMAAAAVCDGRRWQLPLPFTLGGIGLALAGLALSGEPLMGALAAVTALGGLVVNALATRGTWQGGDVLATLWIGLALPATGLLAFALGLAGIAAARVMARWPARSRLPVGGAWLLVAAALLGLPGPLALAGAGAPVERPSRAAPSSPPLLDDQEKAWAELAGDMTARLALIDDRAGRTAAAAATASRMRGLAEDAPEGVRADLAALAAALEAYDLDAIRIASARLAARRDSPHPQEP